MLLSLPANRAFLTAVLCDRMLQHKTHMFWLQGCVTQACGVRRQGSNTCRSSQKSTLRYLCFRCQDFEITITGWVYFSCRYQRFCLKRYCHSTYKVQPCFCPKPCWRTLSLKCCPFVFNGTAQPSVSGLSPSSWSHRSNTSSQEPPVSGTLAETFVGLIMCADFSSRKPFRNNVQDFRSPAAFLTELQVFRYQYQELQL